MRVEPALELGRESCSGKDHAESCSLLVSDACVDDPRDRCRTTAGDERMLREWRPAGPRCVAAITVFKPAEISRLRRCPHIRGSREAAESGSRTERDAANGNPGTRSAWAQQTTSRPASARSAVGQSPSGADSPCTRDRSGLGVSGDTACADHEIAKRVRLAAGLAPTGLPSDEIVYTAADGPSPFAHPLCPNTFRDGSKIGDESPAAGY